MAWVPAFRFTELLVSNLNDGDQVLPGFANRRSLIFVTFVGGAGGLTPDPNCPPFLCPVQVSSGLTFQYLYKDFAPMVTSPWYFRGASPSGFLGIFECYFVGP